MLIFPIYICADVAYNKGEKASAFSSVPTLKPDIQAGHKSRTVGAQQKNATGKPDVRAGQLAGNGKIGNKRAGRVLPCSFFMGDRENDKQKRRYRHYYRRCKRVS